MFKTSFLPSNEHFFCYSEKEGSGFLQNICTSLQELLGLASPNCFVSGVWSFSAVWIISLDQFILEICTAHHPILLLYNHNLF
jgi:hypothetical protein